MAFVSVKGLFPGGRNPCRPGFPNLFSRSVGLSKAKGRFLTGNHKPMALCRKLDHLQDSKVTADDLTRVDRIRLHLRCLYRDRKYRWHLSGVWRELRSR
jgi:hypothetical protein